MLVLGDATQGLIWTRTGWSAMRLVWLLILLVPAASAVPVEMLFHDGPVGILHPDGVREAPPELRPVPGPCPALAPEAWEYVGAWTVDPAHTDDGERRYVHGDHGFGHSFQITDDARVALPIIASEPIRVDATLWVGEYHLAWHGLGEGQGEEVVAQASWQGTPDDPVELVLPTQGLRIHIQDGVLLQIRITSDLPCQPPGTIEWRTDDDAWPMLTMDIQGHAGVVGSAVFDKDGEAMANLIVQHWRGIDGMPEPEFWIDGAPATFVALPADADQAYHHGIDGRTYRGDVPLDGSHEVRVVMHEAGEVVFDEAVLAWQGDGGELRQSCGREKAAGRADWWMQRCLSHGEDAHTTPAPLVPAVLALLWVARRNT